MTSDCEEFAEKWGLDETIGSPPDSEIEENSENVEQSVLPPSTKRRKADKKTVYAKKNKTTKKTAVLKNKGRAVKKTARQDTGGAAPRKKLKAKKKLTPAQKKFKALIEARVTEARDWWDGLSETLKEMIYSGSAYGKEGNPNFPVIDADWIPCLPPRPKSLSRTETPGSRGPAASAPIECGLCGVVLRDMFDGHDHMMLHNQTHPVHCILPRGDFFGGSDYWVYTNGEIDYGKSLGSTEVDEKYDDGYDNCDYYAATRATLLSHTRTKHTIGGKVLTMAALELLVPFLYHKIRKPVPAVSAHPYHAKL